jgi:hypothetical protein
VTGDELTGLVTDIEEAGDHFVTVPPVKGEWPIMTDGIIYAPEWVDKVVTRLRRISKNKELTDEEFDFLLMNVLQPKWWKFVSR